MTVRAWVLFGAVSAVWGIPYLFIKIAVDDGIPPGFLAWSRVVIGSAVLLVLTWRLGLLHGLRPRLPWLAAFAVAEIVGPFPLIAAGEQYVDSGLAAILIAAVPLFVALLALRFDAQERASGSRLAGLVVGLVGVGVLVGVDLSGTREELLGAAALLAAAFGYAVGPLLVLKRHLADIDSRVTMGVSLAIAGVLLTPAAAYDPPSTAPSTGAVVAIVVLGLVCTAGGLTLYGLLNAEIGPGRASVITYVNPVVALALGMVVLDERPGVGAGLGLVMILAGSWLATRTPAQPGDDQGVSAGVPASSHQTEARAVTSASPTATS